MWRHLEYTHCFSWVSGMIIILYKRNSFSDSDGEILSIFLRKFNMQKYDISILYKNKFADFEKELERINENGIDVVKEVILQRKLFIPMLIMYWETIILMAGLLFQQDNIENIERKGQPPRKTQGACPFIIKSILNSRTFTPALPQRESSYNLHSFSGAAPVY